MSKKLFWAKFSQCPSWPITSYVELRKTWNCRCPNINKRSSIFHRESPCSYFNPRISYNPMLLMLSIKPQLSLVYSCIQIFSSVHFPRTYHQLQNEFLWTLSIQCQLEILAADFFSNHVLYFVSAVSSISTKWFANCVETTTITILNNNL